MLNFKKLKTQIIDSAIWRSMFRGGTWKDTSRDRAQHILGNVWLHLHPARVRPRSLKFSFTWGLGGLSFWLFLILTVTGVLLMFYYRPTAGLAYQDIKDLEFVVSLGQFLRNLHRWSAHAMVVVVILHMIRVFLTGSYKKPREFNWTIGVILLTLTLFLSYTGYLLPWDQLALWAVTVGANMAAATPFVGNEGPFSSLLGISAMNDAKFALIGGTSVGQATLVRFYVLHCVAVPILTGIFIMVHFWRIRKDHFSAAPLPGDQPTHKVEVWPNLVVREYVAAILCTIFLIVWSLLQNAPLEGLANPTVTPNPSKAPWYFAGLQELLVYFDPWLAGVVLPNLIIVGLMAIPYLDRDPRGVGYYSFRERPFASTVFLTGVTMWFGLIFIGWFLRGPNWAFYWPWEDWGVHKPPPPMIGNLGWNMMAQGIEKIFPSQFSDGHHILKGPLLQDTRLWITLLLNIPGVLLLSAYFGLGLLLPKWVKKDLAVKSWILRSLGIGVGLTILMGITPWFTLFTGFWLSFSLFVFFVLAFLLPQKHIRDLPLLRYVVTMCLLLFMVGVLLKIGGRLGFDIKYISIYDFSL